MAIDIDKITSEGATGRFDGYKFYMIIFRQSYSVSIADVVQTGSLKQGRGWSAFTILEVLGEEYRRWYASRGEYAAPGILRGPLY